ncbi:hypothetical protein [Streptomyces mirabilis]|uniref:hypothetical protein n=1 Tax=Streptomyces mirabilis TaxID=68239 RepID=UPI003675F186
MVDQPIRSEEQSNTADEGVQQIPAVIQVVQPPAATEARDKLLAAIGAEAERVTEKSDGQAPAALAELARAYALVASGGIASTPPPTGKTLWYHDHAPLLTAESVARPGWEGMDTE